MAAIRVPLLLLALLAFAAGCARSDAWDPGQARLLAGWCEDVARGRQRDADELQIPDPPPGFTAAAAWAAGDRLADGSRRPPAHLRTRAARWPALARALADGRVVTVPGSGLVAPRPGLTPAVRAAAEDLADAENLDRRSIDAVVSRLAGATAAGFPPAAAAQRDAQDAAAGGRPWR
ncbi:MAG: hypothetical protein L6R48_21460 [Planctomycetes bacterium]|nr:hypothetical protein [Planctomycetota bacterium]